ncbi:MAG TPA: NAD(P)-dependent oxidoreductase [Microlunatus sp.]
MRVALLGTGAMGIGMTHALLRAGHRVTVWNRNRDRAETLATDGAIVAADPVTAVAEAEVMITMLFDAASVRQVAEQALPALPADAVWLQMSTVGPDAAVDLDRLAERAGARCLDAPVVGTKGPAEQGTLSTIVSGAASAIERVRPVLEAMSSKITVAGDRAGQASALKLVCNAWTALITAGVAQSIALAEASGIDPSLFLQVIKDQAVDTPLAHLKGEMMIKGDYPPAFTINGLAKDVALIEEFTRAAGVAPSLIEPLRSLVDRAAADGHGDQDMAALRTQF